MSDDQDGCEWVNVSSGTDLPGQSQTKGRQTVVVVCISFVNEKQKITGTWFRKCQKSGFNLKHSNL